MNLVAYTRVSTDKQDISPEMQLSKIKEYCSLYNHNIIARFADVKSAKNTDRIGLLSAMKMCADGKADGIIVYKLDRLTRCVADFPFIIEKMNNKEIVSVSDRIDTSTATGRLFINILLSFSQHERELTGERTRDALASLRAQGMRAGTVGFGYEARDGKGAAVVPCERERAALRLLRALRETMPDGAYSLQDYSNHLADKGFLSRTGVPYTKAIIKKMLTTKYDWE